MFDNVRADHEAGRLLRSSVYVVIMLPIIAMHQTATLGLCRCVVMKLSTRSLNNKHLY